MQYAQECSNEQLGKGQPGYWKLFHTREILHLLCGMWHLVEREWHLIASTVSALVTPQPIVLGLLIQAHQLFNLQIEAHGIALPPIILTMANRGPCTQ